MSFILFLAVGQAISPFEVKVRPPADVQGNARYGEYARGLGHAGPESRGHRQEDYEVRTDLDNEQPTSLLSGSGGSSAGATVLCVSTFVKKHPRKAEKYHIIEMLCK